MRAAVFDGEKIGVREIERPDPGEDGLLIKVKGCGVCGTDVHILKEEFPSSPPVVLGHELSGEVVEAGKDVGSVDVGDSVTVNPNISCDKCTSCRNGKPHLCKNWRGIGIHIDGGYSEFLSVPEEQAFRINADYREGLFSEPLACCLRGIDRLNPRVGETAAVFGGGAVGLLMVQLLKLSGISRLFLSEPIPERRKLAKKLGADEVIDPNEEGPEEVILGETEDGVDNALEVTGVPQVFEMCPEVVRDGGKLLQFGVCPRGAKVPVSPFQIYRKEMDVLGSFTNPFTQQRAVDLIESGELELELLVTHQLPLEKIEEAVTNVENNIGVKVVVRP